MSSFGLYIRNRRSELKAEKGNEFSLRKIASKIEVEPSYLSKVERGIEQPPSEEKIKRIAEELSDDKDVLLAMAGKVSSDLQEIICKRPQLFAELLRELKSMPDHAVLRIVREVRDGEW